MAADDACICPVQARTPTLLKWRLRQALCGSPGHSDGPIVESGQ